MAISTYAELKTSIALSPFSDKDNLLPIFEEYMNFKTDELRDLVDQDKLGI